METNFYGHLLTINDVVVSAEKDQPIDAATVQARMPLVPFGLWNAGKLLQHRVSLGAALDDERTIRVATSQPSLEVSFRLECGAL